MSNLSELLPAGAGAKSADFVASGTLGSGVTVALNSNGTVKVITANGNPEQTASLEYASNGFIIGVLGYDTVNDKAVVMYRNAAQSNYLTFRVLTATGTTVSVGSPVVVASTNVSSWMAIEYHPPSGDFVFMYSNITANQSIVAHGFISGSSFSTSGKGSSVFLSSSTAAYFTMAYDSVADRMVCAFRNNANWGQAFAVRVNSSSLTLGSNTDINGYRTINYITATYDVAAGKTGIFFRDSGDPNYNNKGVVVSVSNFTLSISNTYNLGNLVNGQQVTSAYDPVAEKIVVFYQEIDPSLAFYNLYAAVASISGTALSYGAPALIGTNNPNIIERSACFDPSVNQIILSYSDGNNSSYGTIVRASVSGTSISLSTPSVYYSGAAYSDGIVNYTSQDVNLVTYRHPPNYYGQLLSYKSPASNNTSFIGITDQAIADTATGAVIVQGGVSEKVTGLTTGSDYYVQTDGSLSTTVSSVPAGRALSSTSILLEG